MFKAGYFSRMLRFLGSRVARNIYFWLFLIWAKDNYSHTLSEFIFSAILYGILMVLFYVNNLYLIPKFFGFRYLTKYLVCYTSLALITSFLYVFTYKTMLDYFPQNDLYKVSLVTTMSESRSMSFAGFMHDLPSFFLTLFIGGWIFAMSWFVMDYRRQQKEIDEVKKKHLEVELHFLRNQLNPHFLFNTMNNLYTLTLRKSDNAPEVVAKLSTILRYLLYESDMDYVSFEKEKEIMQGYIDLELLRLSDKKNLHFNIISDKEYDIPPLLWLPVLENAFKYGTRYITDEFFIDFQFAIGNETLKIYSRNKYKERPIEELYHGIGMVNLQKRLELLFPGRFNIDMKSEHDFFTTIVTIQLKDKNDKDSHSR